MANSRVSSEAGQASPRIGILALQGDFAAHAAALREAGADPVLVRTAEQLAQVDGLVLPGGESTTFLELLERGGFLRELEEFVARNPAFGTCAGCILLAKQVTHPTQKSLNVMNVSVERNAYGRQIDSTIQLNETRLPGGPMEMVYIRAPRIAGVGEGVEVLAERDGFPVLVRQGRLLAATFHPELSGDRRVHQLFVSMVREHLRTRHADRKDSAVEDSLHKPQEPPQQSLPPPIGHGETAPHPS